MRKSINRFGFRAYANNLNAWVPEWWARESVVILHENFVMAGLVHRDFEELFQKGGDVVNTRKPAEFVALNKATGQNVTVQDASATNIPVPLDQHVHTAFEIDDVDDTIAFTTLRDEYIRPASIAQARAADKITAFQVYQFLKYQAGTLGGLTNSNAVALITDAMRVMNVNKAFDSGRTVVWNSYALALILQNAVFHEADKRGDTEGLREASIGRKFGADHFHDQTMPYITQGDHGSTTLLINNAAGYAIGTTALTVDTLSSGTLAAGRYVKIGGKVYRVLTVNNAATPTAITLEWGLLDAVADNAVITVGSGAAVDNASGYAVGYKGGILIDNASGALGPTPQVGQLVSFGTGLARYAVMSVTVGATEHTITLDHPLEAALADNDVVHYGPAGGYNLGFHKNAITLAVRPLKPAPEGTGAKAANMSWKNVTSRITMTYTGNSMKLLTVFDYLLGVKVLDVDLGVVILS